MNARALLFTDVVDSTKVGQRLGDAAAAALWAEHDQLARALLAEHGGLEIDRSDGFFLLFDDVASAARFAVGYHATMAALELAARVGIHHGPVTLRQNPPQAVARGAKAIEVEGLAKPLAARVMSLAAGGQTLLSGDAASAIPSGSLPGLELRSHGHYRLKGIEDPLALFELGDERCGFVPPADVDKAYRVVADGDLWRPAREIPHNLAPERDTFVGRTTELRELAAMLDNGARLVSVLGVGGTGKTRLVRRYARAWLGDWPGGVYFCDLSEARSLEGICFSVASALEVPLGKDNPVIQLGHAIAGRDHCLVILDNLEQVLEHAPGTLGRWIDRAAHASFIVTSRERLQLHGEQPLVVEPLRLNSEAIELFTVRARVQRSTFALNDVTRDSVAEIVKLLDGLPLAIELAAARVRVLSPAQIVQRLTERFVVLAGAKGVAARQATLKAAIDWSWDLLAPWEQTALSQCSVFEGGFTLEAAEAVLDLAAWQEAPPVIDVVQALVDKSLLRAWLPNLGTRLEIAEPYFGMYLSIHDYAAARLAESNGAEDAAKRHGHWFARFGRDDMIAALHGREGMRRWRALAADADNLAAACRYSMACQEGEMAVGCYRALCEVLSRRGPYALVAAIGMELLDRLTLEAGHRAVALQKVAWALGVRGQTEQAQAYLNEALELACSLGDQYREAEVLAEMGALAGNHSRSDTAFQYLERALTLFIQVGDRHGEAVVVCGMGVCRYFQDRGGEAVEMLSRSLVLARESGDRRLEGKVLGNLALHLIQTASHAESLRRHEEALAVHRETGSHGEEGVVLGNLGIVLMTVGRYNEAAVRYREAIAICRHVGARHYEGVVVNNLCYLLVRQGALAEAVEMGKAALEIHLEAGNRRSEGIAHDCLADAMTGMARWDDARYHVDEALRIARSLGEKGMLASALDNAGTLQYRSGQLDEGRQSLRLAEELYREIGDRLDLAMHLCRRGEAEARAGDVHSARDMLTEAREVATDMGFDDKSMLGRDIVRLQTMIASLDEVGDAS